MSTPCNCLLAHLLATILVTLPAGPVLGQESQEETVVQPIMGAIYFDAWTIEKEFIVQPLALQEWLDLGLEPETPLDAKRRAEVEETVAAFLAGRSPLSIDGELLPFELDRAKFIEPDPSNFIPIEQEAIIPAREAALSVVFVAPLPSLDGILNLRWDLFDDATRKVRVVAVDVLGSRVFEVEEAKPAFSVQGRFVTGARDAPQPPPAPQALTLEIPWLSILLALLAIPVGLRIVRSERRRGAPVVVLVGLVAGAAVAQKFVSFPVPHPTRHEQALPAKESTFIIDRLLRGVYHAFDYREESKRYDALEKVAGGEALTAIYLEVSRTLEQRRLDGSRVRVHALKVDEAVPAPLEGRRGFSSECEWEVSGKVGHWGHFHERTNRYRALLAIEPLDGQWKITALTLLTRDRQVEENL